MFRGSSRFLVLGLSAAGALAVSTGVLYGQSAQAILQQVQAREAAQTAKVENYTITLSVQDAMGFQVPMYYEKIAVNSGPAFRMVPPDEYGQKTLAAAGFPPPDTAYLAEYAKGLDMLGSAMATGGGDMPPMDVRAMTGGMSAALRGVLSDSGVDTKSGAASAQRDLVEFQHRAHLVGTEPVQASRYQPGTPATTRNAYKLVADSVSDIALPQDASAGTFTLSKVTLWIDREWLVPVHLLMEGTMTANGQTRPVTIERLDLDYRPAGLLFEPYQQVYRLSGLMGNLTNQQRKDLAKAQADYAKMQQQLAKMNPSQRAMVEKMVGAQMKKFEQMTQGDTVTSIVNVVSIAVNEGPPTPYGSGDLNVGGPVAASYPGTLTVTSNEPRGGGSDVAELGIEAQAPNQARAEIGLVGANAYPGGPGSVAIVNAGGHVDLNGTTVAIEGGSGTISVTRRTTTRIVGTFTAVLTGTLSSNNTKIQIPIRGSFDTGVPADRYQAPRGSPFPANLFQGIPD